MKRDKGSYIPKKNDECVVTGRNVLEQLLKKLENINDSEDIFDVVVVEEGELTEEEEKILWNKIEEVMKRRVDIEIVDCTGNKESFLKRGLSFLEKLKLNRKGMN